MEPVQNPVTFSKVVQGPKPKVPKNKFEAFQMALSKFRKQLAKVVPSLKAWLTELSWYFRFNITLWFFLLVALGTVFTIDLDLFKIEELFHDGHKLEGFLYQLSVGFIISFMFYYLVVFLPDLKAKKALGEFLNHELKYFYKRCKELVIAMKFNHGKRDFEWPNRDEIEQLFAASKANDRGYIFDLANPNLIFGEQIVDFYRTFKTMVNHIAIRSKIIDSTVDHYLTKLDHSFFFFFIRGHSSNTLPFNLLGDSFNLFIDEVRNLSHYCNKVYGVQEFDTFVTSKKVTM